MSDFNISRNPGDWEENGADEGASDSGAVPVDSSTSAATFSSTWTEIVASTGFDYHGFILHMGRREQTAGNGAVLRLGIGANPNEKIILDGVVMDSVKEEMKVQSVFIPHFIAKGSRIAAQCSDNTSAARYILVSIAGIGGSQYPSAPMAYMEGFHWSAIGVWNTDDPGASANTKATTWNQVTAALGYTVRRMIIFMQGNASTMAGDFNWLTDVGIGAATLEKVLLPNLRMAAGSTKDESGPKAIGPIPVHIPEGTRVAVRSQCSGTDATDRIHRIGFIFLA